MNWVIASFLMFICSVIRYVLIRKSTLEKVPTQLINFAMFAVSLIIYSTMAVVLKAPMTVTAYQASIIVVLAIFFSYLGNRFSLRSIELAPNPGYSLMLSKSYVVFTTIASLFLFNSELTARTALAIALIIGFSTQIMYSPNKNGSSQHEAQNRLWLYLAIGSFFCWGMLSLTTKYLFSIGVSILARLIYSMSIVVTLILWEMKREKVTVKHIKQPQWINLLIIGLFSAGFDYFSLVGFDLAPNIGYVNAINAASISLVTLCSFFIFHDELTKRKLLGILGVTAGLVMLVV